MYLKRFREGEIILPSPMMRVGGEVRLVRYNEMGQVDYDSGWGGNRIVDKGINDLMGGIDATGNVLFANCYLGDDGTATNDSMVDIQNQLGTRVTRGLGDRVTENSGAASYIKTLQYKFRFVAGNGTGTVREVAFYPGSGNPGEMFSRFVVTPEISKSAQQALDVFYRFSVYPDLSDVNGQVTIDSTLFDVTTRIANCGETDANYIYTLDQPFDNGASGDPEGQAFSDGLAAITSAPSTPIPNTASLVTPQTYVSGNKYWDVRLDADLDDWVGNIRTICFRFNTYTVQTYFDSNVGNNPWVKPNDYIAWVIWRQVWDRH